MFLLQPKPTFQSKVVTFEFKHKGRKALKAFFESLNDTDSGRTDSEALLELINNWFGVDETFTPEALDTLLDNYPSAARAIFDAYNRDLFEGKQKNSGK